LVALARGFIILPGKSGTLAEVAYLWALRRAGLAKGKPVVLLGDPWPDVLDSLAAAGVLEADSLRETILARNENEAVSKALAGSGGPQETP
jgi:predicted Rossmann-fold nucleotide-binding protein